MSKTILVVEDETLTLNAIKDGLVHSGFKVLTAKNGLKALKVAERERPDLILLDIAMPKMDGIKTMEELRKKMWGQSIPIIFLTNLNPDDKMLGKLIEGKATYFFLKNQINITDLAEKIHSLINQ